MAGVTDPINFIPAEQYFSDFDTWDVPDKVESISDAVLNNVVNKAYWRGVTIKFTNGKICVVQFIRPTVWRVRFDPTVTDAEEYQDINSRTIIGDSFSQLIQDLDEHAGVEWKTSLDHIENDHWIFKSTVTKLTDEARERGHYEVNQEMILFIYKNPFRIQAARMLKPVDDLWPLPVSVPQGTSRVRTVWQTSRQTFRYKLDPEHPMIKKVILDVIKAGHGEFIGWGEQGGSSFMKKPTYMNYFNADNMQYQQVYAKGPMNPREPLYHSDPFWLDINSNPEHKNITATFIDNYSQISVDFAVTNSGFIKVGSTFGPMDCYITSGDTVRDIVRLQSAITGRAALKPRYILGNHQSCYGYMNKEDLFSVVKYYRDTKIPLDGLHIDVPLQNNFRTFTVDRKNFSEPEAMFARLKNDGIKCCTNITPVISANDLPGSEGYKTLRSAKEKDYFLKDNRYTKGVPPQASQIEYMVYDWSNRKGIKADEWNERPRFTNDNGHSYRDEYNFSEWYNKGNYYRGGVSYGYDDGTPGHYANLNKKEVQAWWGKQYEDLFNMGLEFVWQDMTTPAIHQSYGDMKGLPSRLWMDFEVLEVTPEGKVQIKKGAAPDRKLAIEVWALYSYNLHKSTFKGLNKLPVRQNKRNFILGRGSYAGMYRYAGLWTGDNASTWDFWRITVSQVLSLGLNGVSISGSDTGGFEPASVNGQEEKICNPELLIRWYIGSTLLPWLRNHYVSRKDINTGEPRKWFQEPYAYPIHFDNWRKQGKKDLNGQEYIYYGVQFIVQYYIQLRYSLIQLLYDTMFENQIHGLPIARSMILTDPQDTTFFNESQAFLDDQYVAGQDILVAPIMYGSGEAGHENQTRRVYFPISYFWFPSNLVPFSSQRTKLVPSIPGGKVLEVEAKIPEWQDGAHGTPPQPDKNGYAGVLPMYIREGAIIPQVEVRDYIGDGKVNPITFNIYPHVYLGMVHKSEYTTYLDDGVSRDSAPSSALRKKQLVNAVQRRGFMGIKEESPDWEGEDKYRAVTFTHKTSENAREIKISRKKKDADYDPVKEIGESYTIILWYEERVFKGATFKMTVTPSSGVNISMTSDPQLCALFVKVEETLGKTSDITIVMEAS